MDLHDSVSVLVPTYNRARYLEECLQSIVSQTVRPLEIVVIDDGSEDATPAVVRSFGPAVRYLHKNNGGKAAALNFALPTLRGDFLWLFDDDDVALPTSIEQRLEVLMPRPALGFVLSGHYLGHDSSTGAIRIEKEYRIPDIADEDLRIALMKGCFATMQSMLVRTRWMKQVGTFDPGLAASEDYDMMLRLAAVARFSIVRSPTFIMRQHEGVRGSRNRTYEAKSRHSVFRKYDGIVGSKLRESLPLGAYLSDVPQGELSPVERCEALLTRMEIMASKGLIDEMFADLKGALRESGGTMPGLARRCRDAVCTGYAADAIENDFAGFLELAKSLRNEPGGKRTVRYLAAGLFRLAKSYPGDVATRRRRAGNAMRLMVYVAV